MALLERQAANKATIASPVPKVSVVMPAYNQERYCGEAIESILAQTFAAFECIIVDDGSSDGTSALLEWYARSDARIHLIRHEVNRGISASLNAAIGRARCELIARMDADDIALPHRLERQVAFMEHNPAIVAAGSSYRTIDDGGAIIGGIYAMESDPRRIRLGMAGGPMLAHPTVIMRRSLVLKAGGYRTAFDLAEDLDLWLRLMETGELGNIPEVLLHYRMHSGNAHATRAYSQRFAAAMANLAARRRGCGKNDPINATDFYTEKEMAHLLEWSGEEKDRFWLAYFRDLIRDGRLSIQ
jgi:glycosyltransferase involved in cell wall biosynthesis